jgi:hypothetical protein
VAPRRIELSTSCDVPVEVLGQFVQDVAAEAEWVPMLESLEVLSADEAGLVQRGRLTTSILGIVKETYEIEYAYEPNVMHYRLPGPTRLQKVQEGSYSASDNGDGTSTFSILLLTQDSVPAPSFVKKSAAEKVQRMIMAAAKSFVEEHRGRYET